MKHKIKLILYLFFSGAVKAILYYYLGGDLTNLTFSWDVLGFVGVCYLSSVVDIGLFVQMGKPLKRKTRSMKE